METVDEDDYVRKYDEHYETLCFVQTLGLRLAPQYLAGKNTWTITRKFSVKEKKCVCVLCVDVCVAEVEEKLRRRITQSKPNNCC